MKTQIQPQSKSLLTTINLGYNLPQVECEEKITITYKENPELDNTFQTGFVKEGIQQQIPPSVIIQREPPKFIKEDSVIDTVDTGFGAENKVLVECAKPEYKTPLFKENYLGEFKTNIEKQNARNNLEVYSKQEVSEIVYKIINSATTNIVTKEYVDEKVKNLDFTTSVLKSQVSYNIPTNLFKL